MFFMFPIPYLEPPEVTFLAARYAQPSSVLTYRLRSGVFGRKEFDMIQLHFPPLLVADPLAGSLLMLFS